MSEETITIDINDYVLAVGGGAVRLTDRFFSSATLHPSAVSSCRSHVRSTLMVLQTEVTEFGFDVAVASSGTAETIARLIQDRSDKSATKTLNRFEFTQAQIAETVTMLGSVNTVDERREKFGLEKSRAEIILAGAIILEGISSVYGVESFMYSDYALREGVILDTLQRRGLGAVAGRAGEGPPRQISGDGPQSLEPPSAAFWRNDPLSRYAAPMKNLVRNNAEE